MRTGGPDGQLYNLKEDIGEQTICTTNIRKSYNA